MYFNCNVSAAFLWLLEQGSQVFLSLGKYRYWALHEPQGNLSGLILGRVPRITHISSLHNLCNCTGCNDVNITVFLPKSERSELVSTPQIAGFLIFLIYFAVLYYVKDKGRCRQNKGSWRKEQRKTYRKTWGSKNP